MVKEGSLLGGPMVVDRRSGSISLFLQMVKEDRLVGRRKSRLGSNG